MLINNLEFRSDVVGMPDSHAEKFMEVAKDQKCIIISRAVGPTCLQLLEEGYDTKGFRIHAKSCCWGPMAGFVMRDPRLNKAGFDKEEYNRKEHRTALRDTNNAGWKASITPLKLSAARVHWLKQKGKIIGRMVNNNLMVGVAQYTSLRFHYVLRREIVPAIGEVWGVYVDNKKSASFFRQECGSRRPKGGWGGWILRPVQMNKYEPLMAMTNPPEHRAYPEGHYLNAITGDYDLFAVWPRSGDYDPNGMDRRVLGTVNVITERAEIDRMEQDFVQGVRQSTKLGNITDRIYLVSQILNSAIAGAWSKTGSGWRQFDRRQVCWHSTESARPYVDDVDLPIIAFVPWKSGIEAGLETIVDFKQLIIMAERLGYRVLLSEGWVLDPTDEKIRLGREWADRVPTFEGGQQKVPDWYNN